MLKNSAVCMAEEARKGLDLKLPENQFVLCDLIEELGYPKIAGWHRAWLEYRLTGGDNPSGLSLNWLMVKHGVSDQPLSWDSGVNKIMKAEFLRLYQDACEGPLEKNPLNVAGHKFKDIPFWLPDIGDQDE